MAFPTSSRPKGRQPLHTDDDCALLCYQTPTNANAATGWGSKGHKFSDLTGSDEATFQFTDKTGKVVLSFQEDYISQATSATFGDGVTIHYPSGYGTLGLGGDGCAWPARQ